MILDKLKAVGDACWRMRMRILACGTAMIVLVMVLGGLWFFQPMDATAFLKLDRSPVILDRHQQPVYVFLNQEEQYCLPREIDAFSPYLIQATVAVEDQRFYDHHGVDPVAVVRAFGTNLRRGRVVSGASTLTMQLVKLHDVPSHHIAGKLKQTLLALRLERAVEKDTILAAYLNCAPYGENLIGAEAAAQRYYGKSARELSLSEAALIAGLPQNPSRHAPLRNAPSALQRRNHVLHRMAEEGGITQEQLQTALEQPLGVTRHAFPQQAPHFSLARRDVAITQGVLVTTLDAAIQQEVQEVVAAYSQPLQGHVQNAAALVVDTRSGAILAWAGSADFMDPDGGQYDVVHAPRSPGSTLKPFLYGLAMQRHQLYASEILLDAAWDKGRYNPLNFDRDYAGLVTASEALRRSLNVPAVLLLERTGVQPFHRFLRDSGFETLRPTAEGYGLGLTLGEAEVTLFELVRAYRMIADLGTQPGLHWREAAEASPQSLVSPGICQALYAMLEQPFPGDLDPHLVAATADRRRVAWKTGTSPGQRDAWTVMFNRQYVVGVWLGNNDGQPSHKLVGAHVALPLAAALFKRLPALDGPAWPRQEHLETVQVCGLSGLPVSPWCTQCLEVPLPDTQWLNRRCDVHVPGKTDGVVRERWPVMAAGWDLARIETSGPPVTEARATASRPLKILSPAWDAEFVLTGDHTGDRIALASSWDGESAVYWFSDGRYLGVSNGKETLSYTLDVGEHTITCLLDSGESHTVRFTVVHPDELTG